MATLFTTAQILLILGFTAVVLYASGFFTKAKEVPEVIREVPIFLGRPFRRPFFRRPFRRRHRRPRP